MLLKDYIDFDELSYFRICELLQEGIPFSFARYGDGEFNAIFRRRGANCDGHNYYPEMGMLLELILLNEPDYYIGVHHNEKMNEEMLDFYASSKAKKGQYVDSSVFHYPTRDNQMGLFWDSLLYRKVLIVAPSYVQDQQVIPHAETMTIPGKNTFAHLQHIYIDLTSMDLEGYVVLFCASMVAPLLIDMLHSFYTTMDKDITLIDFGSTFDPYVGVKSRSYHKVK